MNKIIQVTAAVMLEQQRVLIAQRQAHGWMAGKWEFPGGKIEPGETPEACLQRELQEELDILAEVGALYHRHVHAFAHVTIELITYQAAMQTGPIVLHAHQDYCWAAVSDLPTFDFCEADWPIVAKLVQEFAVASPAESQGCEIR